MFYDYEEKQPIDTFDTLVSYYKSNTAKIEELNVTNELLKLQATELMRNEQPLVLYFETKTYTKVQKYLNKDIKRGHEDYKDAKSAYDYILKILQDKISPDIKKIDKIIQRIGFSYSTVGEEICFTVGQNEYELHVPISKNLRVDDIFRGDYIEVNANKYQLYARTSNCSITRIWTGVDLDKLVDEVDLTKDYRKDK